MRRAKLSPKAIIAKSAVVGQGSVILAGAHVENAKFSDVTPRANTGASLDHDSRMADFSSLGPGTFTGGHVIVGECSATGVGASLSDRVNIGAHSVAGTGSVVVRNIPSHSVAYGNPARVRRGRKEDDPYVAMNPNYYH